MTIIDHYNEVVYLYSYITTTVSPNITFMLLILSLQVLRVLHSTFKHIFTSLEVTTSDTSLCVIQIHSSCFSLLLTKLVMTAQSQERYSKELATVRQQVLSIHTLYLQNPACIFSYQSSIYYYTHSTSDPLSTYLLSTTQMYLQLCTNFYLLPVQQQTNYFYSRALHYSLGRRNGNAYGMWHKGLENAP